MNSLVSHHVWRKRLNEIDNPVQDLHIPKYLDDKHDQDEEWCEVVTHNKTQRIRFHDYDEVFGIPGLYEKLFYDTLECCSPSYVVNLLKEVANEWNAELSNFKVLDVGAGNGMVGDELRNRGVRKVVGVDIIKEAKEATLRDRPDVYDDYRVADLTNLPKTDEIALRNHGLNCMTTVAALGYGDIPPLAFLKALDLISTPAWLAFNIKEDFLHDSDQSGFSRLIRQLIQEDYIQPQCYRRYRHRLSIAGEPLYYIAMIARKCKPVGRIKFIFRLRVSASDACRVIGMGNRCEVRSSASVAEIHCRTTYHASGVCGSLLSDVCCFGYNLLRCSNPVRIDLPGHYDGANLCASPLPSANVAFKHRSFQAFSNSGIWHDSCQTIV